MRYQYQIFEQAPQNTQKNALIFGFLVYVWPFLEFIEDDAAYC